MAYYSGKQLFIFCTITGIFTLVLVLAFGVPGGVASIFGGDKAQVSRGEEGSSTSEGSDPMLGEDGLPILQTGDTGLVEVQQGGDYSEDERNNIEVYRTYSEAVVNISTEVINYDFFFEPVPSVGGTGSGSIIDKRGYILTNNHVIEGANKLFVTLADGERLEAQVVGRDAENDLAVIKIDPGSRVLVAIPLGVSSNLAVGQKVIAIGNPFSFDRTMTTGIVSALGRPIRTKRNVVIQGMIQTDASINPGNSGGPLLDRRGNMIGINTMIYTESGGSVGLGFAVPVDTARRVVPELIRYGVVKRGWIDVTPIQLFPELVRFARLPVTSGLLVSRVEAGGQAARLGVLGGSADRAVRYGRTIINLGGDIITSVDGFATATIADLYTALEDNKPGDVVKVVLIRGSRTIELSIPLIERPTGYVLE